jgi:hypothetical protein
MNKCWDQVPENRISIHNALAYYRLDPLDAIGTGPGFMAQARQDCE